MFSVPLGSRNKKKVLFYAESPVKYAMFRPIQKAMASDSQVQFWFAGQLRGGGTSRSVANSLGVEGASAIGRGLSTLVAFDLFLTADYDLWSGYEKRHLPVFKTPKVQIFHGASIRNGAIQEGMKRYQHLFITGPYMYRKFVEAGIFEEGDPRMIRVGMPKTDRLVDGSLNADSIRQDLGLDPSRPTVMFAPTWLRESPVLDYGEELIERLLEGPWNVLIKLHDTFFDPRFNLVDWKQKLRAYSQRDNCVVAMNDFDAVPMLRVADLLISDVSSIANEFTLLDRPLVYLKVERSQLLDKYYPHLDLDTWGQKAGEVVTDAESCFAAVERGLSDPSSRSDVRRALAHDVFFNHGTSAAVAADATRGILGLGEMQPTP